MIVRNRITHSSQVFYFMNIKIWLALILIIQFSSVAQSCLTLCDPMNHSTPGLPVHNKLPEFTQTHAPRVGDAIQPSHPLSLPSPLAPNPSQNQGLFQWVNSSHELAKVLEFQLPTKRRNSFNWIGLHQILTFASLCLVKRGESSYYKYTMPLGYREKREVAIF